jgi:undecaprenyl-diphosphatase
LETLTAIIEYLEELDASILLAINSWNHPVVDEIMWFLTGKIVWFPFYAFLLFLVFKNSTPKQFLLFFLVGVATIGFADFIANVGFKHTIQRYRPSHHLIWGELLHYFEHKPGELYKGGQYGFVSGHATNSFAIAWYFGLFLKQFYKRILALLMIWATVIIYTRLYLGVHYPSDIIGGFIVGSIIAFLGNYAFRYINIKKK